MPFFQETTRRICLFSMNEFISGGMGGRDEKLPIFAAFMDKITDMKKIAAIHDLSGYGRASLTVAIPVLSAMGCQVCPLPTAVLSAHSEYPGFRSLDLTDHMQPIIDHWRELGLRFDALYSGYLASGRQLDIVERFFVEFGREDNFVVVDPVMGDRGVLYPGMDAGMVEGMRRLCGRAKVVTPNLTEAAFLLGREVCGARGAGVSVREAEEWCVELAGMGPEYSIVTSAPAEEPGRIATLAYDRREGKLWRVCCEELPASYPGTGDAFASAVTGGLLRGETLPEAVARAVYFIHEGIRETMACEHDPLDGMHQEKVLHCLAEPVERGR